LDLAKKLPEPTVVPRNNALSKFAEKPADGGWTPGAAKAWEEEQPDMLAAEEIVKPETAPAVAKPTETAPAVTPAAPNLGMPKGAEQRSTESVQTPILNPELVESYKDSMERGQDKVGTQYDELLRQADEQGGKDETERAKLAGQRQEVLTKYTQGLDEVGKARFMDSLIKNIGKIVAGGANLMTGVDVAKNYKYEGADTEGMRKDVGDTYAAQTKALDDTEKARKENADADFNRRRLVLNAAADISKTEQDGIAKLLEMEKGIKNTGTQTGYDFVSPEWMQWLMSIKDEKTRQEALRINLEYAKLAAGIYEKKIGAEAAVKAGAGKQVAQQGAKTGEVFRRERKPENLNTISTALSNASPGMYPNLTKTEAWGMVLKNNRPQDAAILLSEEIRRKANFHAARKNPDEAAKLAMAADRIDLMAPFLTDVKQLNNLSGTLDTLSQPGGPLAGIVYGTTETSSSENSQSNTTTVPGVRTSPTAPTRTPVPEQPAIEKTYKVGGKMIPASQYRAIIQKAIDAEKDPAKKAALQSKLKGVE
jgi:hypothetical protein